MRMLFVVDLHYTLKQLDRLVANAGCYDLAGRLDRIPPNFNKSLIKMQTSTNVSKPTDTDN
jgi:hypothetical protein